MRTVDCNERHELWSKNPLSRPSSPLQLFQPPHPLSPLPAPAAPKRNHDYAAYGHLRSLTHRLRHPAKGVVFLQVKHLIQYAFIKKFFKTLNETVTDGGISFKKLEFSLMSMVQNVGLTWTWCMMQICTV